MRLRSWLPCSGPRYPSRRFRLTGCGASPSSTRRAASVSTRRSAPSCARRVRTPRRTWSNSRVTARRRCSGWSTRGFSPAARGWGAPRHGRVVHDGITVALVGPPNAGKSSLLNALLGRDRAIVSPVPGTTRDVVDGTITIAGVPVRLLDTAGLDVPRDAIEAEGIRRSRRAMEESDLLLVVLDGSILPDQRVLEETAGRARVIVRAKCDLPAHPAAAAQRDAVAVSAVSGEGIEALLERLAQEVEDRAAAAGDEGGIVASLRQFELLHALSTSLAAGECALGEAPLEAALVDLKDALDHAGAVLGVDVGDVVLDHIFATFCLGK